MGAKEFFKPTKSKLFLWSIVFLIMPWRERVLCIPGARLLSDSTWHYPSCPPIKFFSGFDYLKDFILYIIKGYSKSMTTVLLHIIVMLFVSYLLSCIMIFIYVKIKGIEK